jgi:hypothetical protein
MDQSTKNLLLLLVALLLALGLFLAVFIKFSAPSPVTTSSTSLSSPTLPKTTLLDPSICINQGGVLNPKKTFCCNKSACPSDYCGQFTISKDCGISLESKSCDKSIPPCSLYKLI